MAIHQALQKSITNPLHIITLQEVHFWDCQPLSCKKETVTNPQALTRNQDNVALSYGVNAMFGRNNFGISLSLGFDVSVGKNSDLWIYQNKPWLGIGVSTNLGLLK